MQKWRTQHHKKVDDCSANIVIKMSKSSKIYKQYICNEIFYFSSLKSHEMLPNVPKNAQIREIFINVACDVLVLFSKIAFSEGDFVFGSKVNVFI